ncbi:MAG: choice-of-anchor L domain-containing protein, partial [Polyangiaceae bacterium]|nr:choice-of-anchor L domain-containing protein [Polyangiaceae bacterium]
ELEIRVPTNAKSFSFNFNFFTFEYPEYICSVFNDFFVTLMWPKHPDLPDPNIAFDIEMNPISVNNGLLQVCTKGTHGGKTFDCPLGAGALQGTGFLGHAATGWLVTQAPVEPASILKLRFAIWDSGDAMLDSTVLIDNFRWDTETVESIATTPDVIF